ncbi:MAG TPA: tetratricopeptide repeat protein [Planctomycetes bacterium]|nr:tetratricopeptide repeat protein [Planctomycetota bacterium]
MLGSSPPWNPSRYHSAVLRLIGFFVLVFVVRSLLVHVPVIGPLFARTGWIGLWLTAMLLSFVFGRVGERMVRVQRDRAEVRRLLAVDSPHAHGKVGALLLAQGRARAATPHLERAVQGEPDAAEWHYRLGLALSARGERTRAIEELRRALEIDPERGYGTARMRLAQALFEAGEAERSLAELETFERLHGPTPESAYRRARALRVLGRREKARAALDEVGTLAREAARYQKGGAAKWVARAALARIL